MLGTIALLSAAILPALASEGALGRGGHQFALQIPGSLKGFGPEGEFIWEKITPTKNLVWYDCYSARQCARLLVPLDYSNENDTQAAIALVRIPSTYPTSSADYRGPVLFNPGGPGGSGVDLVTSSTGEQFVKILGPQFDIVGFDPRGIARSTPKGEAFDTNAERKFWGADAVRLGPDDGDAGVTHEWARSQILGKLASQRASSFIRHINTENTARDMLRIVEAHGRSKLQYWGFSYGSILGATYASILPDKIERLIIDGVADAENYFATLWSNNLMDTDKTMQAFYDGCYSAGPSGCPFYASSPGLIAQRLSALYDNVLETPLSVITDQSYGIVDRDRLQSTVFNALYKPYVKFHPLAQALADLENGNATTIYQMTEVPSSSFGCSCDSQPLFSSSVNEGHIFVACTDGKPVPSDLDSSLKHYNDMSRSSQWGGMWSSTYIQCSGWPQFTRTHFQGPFTANTSFPILLIGNTADPVTPLWAAQKMSKGFTKSMVITQDTPGHCSLAMPSLCTTQYIRDYFVDGSVPTIGTICAATGSPWPRLEAEMMAQENLSQEDWELLQAARELSRSFEVPHMFRRF